MAAAVDPISAIAGAIGDTAQSVGQVATAVGSIFSSRNERKAVEAQSQAQTNVALSQQEMARIGYLNTGMNGLVSLRQAELEIQRQQVENQAGFTPITALVVLGGLTFFALVVYFILLEMRG